MENKNDRAKLKEVLQYIEKNFVFMNRSYVKDIMMALTLSNDTFVANKAGYYAHIVERGNETFIKNDAVETLKSPEFALEYNITEQVQMKEYPIDRLAQARSYATKQRKKGLKVEELKSPDGNKIILRWRETIDKLTSKVFAVGDLIEAAKFAEEKKREGFQIIQEVVNERIVIKWKEPQKKESSSTTTEKPDTPKNLKI